MKRQWMLAAYIIALVVVLTGCSGQSSNQQMFTEYTQALGPTATPAAPTATPEPSDPSVFSQNPYDDYNSLLQNDALNEESIIDPNAQEEFPGDGGNIYGAYDANATVYPYAGSTPIPLTPIDAPTPTPRPELTFTYGTYTASIGLSFDAPTGWTVDETQNDMFILTEPTDQVKDNQPCVLTISAVPVTSNYSKNNLKTEVLQRLDSISATNFKEWKPSLTAERYLLGSQGVYANYTGVLADETKVGGRIHYTCKNNTLYSIEIVFPLGYKNDYLNIFAKVRETIATH